MKQKLKMLKRWLRIVSGKTNVSVRQEKGKIYSYDLVKGYYSDMTGKIEKGYRRDEDGIPLTNIGEQELAYFPIDIMNFGLAYYDMYLLSGNRQNLQECLKITDWCCSVQRENGSWDCFGPVHSMKYTVSSLGQGLGVSLLIRAYIATDNFFYLERAKKALDFMLLPTNQGGTAIYVGDDCFLEEYPQKDKRSVLNGWIFSIFGIWDYCKISGDEEYWNILIKTKNTLKKTLPQYDFKIWTYYDLQKMIASPHYQQIHYNLLEIMYEMFQDETFDFYRRKWQKQYTNILFKICAIIGKVFQKLFETTDVVSID